MTKRSRQHRKYRIPERPGAHVDITKKLIEARKKAGLNKSQASRLAELGWAQLHEYETGKVQPGLDVLERLAHVYGIEVRDFF